MPNGDEIQKVHGKGPGGQAAQIEKYKEMGYVPGLGFTKQAQTSSSDAPATRTSQGERRIDDSLRDGFNTNAATGQVGATGISAANNSGDTSSGNQQQGFAGGNHSDKTQFNPALQKKTAELRAASVCLFPDIDTSKKEGRLELKQRVGMMNEYARRNINVDAETIGKMDLEDVQKGLNKAANAPLLQPED